jgi:GT2 family glycosyltransferase
MLILCTPTYKRYDLCGRMIDSARQGTVKPDGVFVLDNGGTLDIEQPAFRHCNVITLGMNIGVARGWNYLMNTALDLYGPDVWTLIVNDDIEFLPDTIEKFTSTITSLTVESDLDEYPILCGADMGLNAFSMFACQPARLKRVLGWFDESIWPAYFDDNDMHYRMKLAKLDLFRIPDCHANHAEGGSATLKSYTAKEEAEHHVQFRRNQVYYILKWGGLPGEETYTTPFDNRDIMQIMREIYGNYGF